ncbi:hypothetical protein RchiOBHm_Chr5g0014611 [Rosa chinensis]|uniref:Transmembrane protein n=1 Tax=Rosa chinensis TaxID=74649 RepID=A0A2P6Q5P5_ROSCH|nr:hypothetical protein RchiOBHm_Chr5g0014611 [Rosa chinensis]
MMVKEMSYIHDFGEVAPTMLISQYQRTSKCPTLETIDEEGSTSSHNINFEIPATKRVLFLLPVFVSFASYYFLLYTSSV